MDTNSLVVDHLHIPQIVARERARPVDREDMQAHLYLTLVQAARAYDPARGEFAPYAWLRVRGAAIDYLRDLDPATRRERAAIKAGDAPETGANLPPLSLNRLIDEVGYDPAAVGDFTDDTIRRADTRPSLRDALAALPARHRAVVVDRFWHEAPNEDVGARLGVSVSRVSQLHTEAIRRLRAHMTTTST